MLYASFGFLFYFFDVAWVFQRDFFTGADAGVGPAYALIMSLLMVLAGCGFLTSFWLLVCDYVGETRKALKVIPAVVFVAASVAVLLIVPEGGLRSFAFYSPRALYLFWMLAFAGAWYLRSKDAAERARLRRHLGLYGALWIFWGCPWWWRTRWCSCCPILSSSGRARTLPSATSPKTR